MANNMRKKILIIGSFACISMMLKADVSVSQSYQCQQVTDPPGATLECTDYPSCVYTPYAQCSVNNPPPQEDQCTCTCFDNLTGQQVDETFTECW
jgi:hypothetical protein